MTQNVTNERTNERTNKQMNIQTDKRKNENYIPRRGYNEQMWWPNHFVSCHVIDDTKPSNEKQSSCGQPPLKKQKKVSDFFPSETKDNEPPSADAQSQEHTDEKTESSF